MSQIRRPAIHLPPAPRVYNQQEEQEFRRVVERILTESIEDTTRPSPQTTFAIGPQTGDDATERYYYSWTVSGAPHPHGTTYNVVYEYTNGARTLTEKGTVTNATSGGYIQSGGNIGPVAPNFYDPIYVVTVNAMNAGQIISTASRTGTFLL